MLPKILACAAPEAALFTGTALVQGFAPSIIPIDSPFSHDCHHLALIGSRRVADSLKELHPKSNCPRAILGLDAKRVGIVMPDADFNGAVKESLLGSLSFNGQRGTALKLFMVHEAAAKINQLKPAYPGTPA